MKSCRTIINNPNKEGKGRDETYLIVSDGVTARTASVIPAPSPAIQSPNPNPSQSNGIHLELPNPQTHLTNSSAHLTSPTTPSTSTSTSTSTSSTQLHAQGSRLTFSSANKLLYRSYETNLTPAFRAFPVTNAPHPEYNPVKPFVAIVVRRIDMGPCLGYALDVQEWRRGEGRERRGGGGEGKTYLVTTELRSCFNVFCWISLLVFSYIVKHTT